MLMGFLPFVIGALHLYLAVISWSMWPGYVKGAEFSVLDALALALYLALPQLPHRLPFWLPLAMYLSVVVLSAFQATAPQAALFYAWQLLRMFFVYSVIAKACTFDARGALALLKGMGAGLAMEAVFAAWERVGHGEIQAAGTLGDKNLLGLMSHFVVFPAFALLLAGHRGRAPARITLTGLIAVVLTTSRASVGLAAVSYAAVFTISAMRRWTSRKAQVLLAGAVILVLTIPIAVVSFQQRFGGGVATDYDERAAFMHAAQMMLADHPFGVGANHYVVSANTERYNELAGVAPTYGSESANVHNVYMLVLAETGYLGLISFAIFLLSPLWMSIRYSWRYRREERGDFLLGLAAALLTVYVHSAFEWVFVTFNAQYLFAFDIGLVAALAQAATYSPLSQGGASQVTASGKVGRYRRSPSPDTVNDRRSRYTSNRPVSR
jgi:O-antigen ligase